MGRVLSHRWLKAGVFVVSLAPLLWLALGAMQNRLGPNPIEYITRSTGDWTLRFLVLTIAITPFRRALGVPDLIRFRRMLGLFAFFYGSLHLLTYLWFDRFFDFADIAKDIAKRPFITAGFFSFAVMAPLAVTSTAGWIRRLGGRRWQLLHRLVYLSVIAGVVHYVWLVKSDLRDPLLYGALTGLFLAYRFVPIAGR
ncbi:MAG: sulfoxide reductase heme-binding subunit YedZ [Bryobacter sp.]|jgi:sulfoxide reductase heme-binding subunit YedZ|nr:sulfoxide reductase heme-binding subunit YedZ [Bryobacter sp.]